jgi:hypothetical protein
MTTPDLHPGEAAWKKTLHSYAPASKPEDWQDMARRLDQTPPPASGTLTPLLLGLVLGALVMLGYLLSFPGESMPAVVPGPADQAVSQPEELTRMDNHLAPDPLESAFSPATKGTSATHRAEMPSVLVTTEEPSKDIPFSPRSVSIPSFSELTEEQYTPGLMSVSRIKTRIYPVKYEGWILPFPPKGKDSNE